MTGHDGDADVQVFWDDDLLGYDFGTAHPLAPVRVELTMRLARELGVLDRERVRVVSPPTATDEVLTRVHTQAYVDAVRRAAASGRPDFRHGLGTSDNPVFTDMHEVTARVVGGAVAGAEAVWSGQATHAVNITGGLHHAMADAASGFCVYNDVAVGIATLLERGAERVAYVDVDVHHGDGVEHAFWDDPRVLTVSIHESGRTLFPGTGAPDDIGGAGAEGRAVNVALPAGTDDAGWLRAFEAVVPPLVEAFTPQVLVTQHGCDSHVLDPLAHLTLSVDAQRASYLRLHELAHAHAGGRWLSHGGGGYAVIDVVPRSWTHLLAVATGEPVDPRTPTPQAWRAYVEQRTGRAGPEAMGDGADAAYEPWSPAAHVAGDAVDRSIAATRTAVFRLHGLDPGV